MKETSDNEMNDASEDNNMEPPTKRRKPNQPNEENDDYLDDKSLLKASHVCKSFASAAETAFGRKYSNKFYCIDYHVVDNTNHTTTKSFDKVMLNKYGGKIRKIEVIRGDEDILDLVKQKCCSVKSLQLVDVPNIVMLKGFTEVSFDRVYNLGREKFVEFIDMNPQLEFLELRGIQTNVLDALDGRLNNLKTLKYLRSTDVGVFPPRIRLKSMEALHLNWTNTTNCIRFLQSVNCNQIKQLTLKNRRTSNEDNGVINEICKFETLVSLNLTFHRITLDKVSKLAAHLPHLTEFATGTAKGESELTEKIRSITLILPKITKLKIRLGVGDFDRLANELKSSAVDFHARFAKSNTEIKLSNSYNKIFITTDFLYLFQEYSVQLHWMDNLNEKNVRKWLNSSSYVEELKFINNCVGRSFDISALASSQTECLNFKSNGPISVKSNASRYHTWFPLLKTLKIHLEQYSANDFLRSLETDFCEQIEELWLNTKADTGDPDMTHILAKFVNLKSLHLDPAFIKFDANHLFAVCRKLTEIKRICDTNKTQ